jgi:hypothetical protein
MTSEHRVSSWGKLQESLFAGSWNSELRRFRSHYAFRGLSDARYRLDTSLMRLKGPYTEMEAHLLRNFQKYAHGGVVDGDSIWHWLALAQHHGLPTRLLDWTFSPYVAMHFATSNLYNFELDGVIWAINYSAVHRQLPLSLSQELRREGSDVFTVNMLSKQAGSLQAVLKK